MAQRRKLAAILAVDVVGGVALLIDARSERAAACTRGPAPSG
jgi:hypothetical protein